MASDDVLFVYGTLMRGERAHGVVAAAERVVPASLAGRLWDTGRGYPAVIDAPALDGTRVTGEALFFTDLARRFPQLDAYEGCEPASPETSLYLRVRRTITLASPALPGEPTTCEAWVYVMPVEREPALAAQGGRPIPSGRWKNAWTSAP